MTPAIGFHYHSLTNSIVKTVLDKLTREELVRRINTLGESSKAQWGKMNVNQMLTHGASWDEMVLRNKKYKRPLIGVLLGGLFLKKELKDDRPMRHNNPTIPDLEIKELIGDFETAKKRWISMINEYGMYSFPDHSFVHPFFWKDDEGTGRLFRLQDTDHHLRQFKS